MITKQVAKDIDTVINVFMNPENYFPKSAVSYSFIELQKRVNDISTPLEDVLEIMKEEGFVVHNKPTSKHDDYTWSYTTQMTKLYLSGGMVKQWKRDKTRNRLVNVGVWAAVVAAITGIVDLIYNWTKK